jgi:hypothetical protein
MLYRDRVLNVAGSVRLKSSVTPDAAGAAAGGLRVQREAHVLQDVGVEPQRVHFRWRAALSTQ